MQWVAAARRPLRVEEFQEAVATLPEDTQWDGAKIPDIDKLLQSCHGLIVRDSTRNIHFAHHTVIQYLLKLGATNEPYYYHKFLQSRMLPHFTIDDANFLAAQVCATYLQFSDFQRAVTAHEGNNRKLTVNTVFRNKGPLAIPGTLGLNRHFYSVPQKVLGLDSSRVGDFDFSKYVRSKPVRPAAGLRKQYGILPPRCLRML